MKLNKDKPVPSEAFFSIIAYTALELVGIAGQVKEGDLKEMLVKEYPGGEGPITDVFDALVDSRLLAYRPSKQTYRLSQSGKLTFTLAHCVVVAMAAGAVTDDTNEKNESLQ